MTRNDAMKAGLEWTLTADWVLLKVAEWREASAAVTLAILQGEAPNIQAAEDRFQMAWAGVCGLGSEELRVLAAEVAGQAEADQAIGNLLAVMHSDGGHYRHEHGTAKAAADAEAYFYDVVRERDRLAHELRLLREAVGGEGRVTLPRSMVVQLEEAISSDAREGLTGLDAQDYSPLLGEMRSVLRATRFTPLSSDTPERSGGEGQ